MKISPKIYARGLYSAYTKNPSHHTISNFLKLLKKKNDIKLLKKIFKNLKTINEEKNQFKTVKIKSAFELNQNFQKQLTENLEKKLKREVRLEITIDKNILGGIIIQIDDKIYDGSLKNKIKKLRERF